MRDGGVLIGIKSRASVAVQEKPWWAQRVQARSGIILITLMILGVFLRFARIGLHSVFFDEAYIAWLSSHRWPDLFMQLRFAEFHPPLHYVLMKLWIGVAGYDEVALRTPSAIFGSVSIVLIYFLARGVASESVSLLSALLVAVSPFEIIAAQDGKMYTLLEMLVLGATLALAYALEHRTLRLWALYAVLAAAIVYTHYLGGFVLLAHGVWVSWRHRADASRWLAAMSAAGALYLPWVPSLLVQLHQAAVSPGWGEPGLLWNIEGLVSLFAFGGSLFGAPGFFYMNTWLSPVALLALILPFLIVFAAGVYAMRRNRDAFPQFGLPVLVVIGCAFLSVQKSFFLPRWFSFLVPFYAVFLATGLASIGERLGKFRQPSVVLLTAGLLAYYVPVLDRQYFDPSFRDRWRDAAAMVGEQFRQGDVILYGEPQSELIFTYYIGARRPSMILAIGTRYFGGAVPVPRLSGKPGVPTPLSVLAGRYQRIWLVVAPPFRPYMLKDTVAVLQRSAVLAHEFRFLPAPGAAAGVYPLTYLFVSRAP
ncbi:MAG TPA: glycosyltransferase family 39 protein [bacterium]|nr:glycosyltransferase family 39 protein [bacterium]